MMDKPPLFAGSSVFSARRSGTILIPSARYAGHGGTNAGPGSGGCFRYERAGSVLWSG